MTRSVRFRWRLATIPALATILVLGLLPLYSMPNGPKYPIPKVYAKTVRIEKKIKPKKSRRVVVGSVAVVLRSRLKVPTLTRYTPAQVSGYIAAALRMTHEPRSWARPLFWMAYQESRFYTRAVDGAPAKNSDLAGDSEHAEGLMPVVPSTFRRHAPRGMRDIWDPIDNAAAAVRYIAGRYRSPYRIPGVFRANQYKG